MKIIDFERKGNVVRYYLGDDDCEDYWGDDWNDAPYDCNAGTVYERYMRGYRDVAYAFDDLVLEPCSGAYNCSWSKKDMKDRKVPCVIVVPADVVKSELWNENFSYWVGTADVERIYFGDPEEPNVILSEQTNH